MPRLDYQQAVENAEHLIALDETTIYLHGDQPTFPYEKVTRVESGSCYRLNGPASCYLIAEDAGLSFRLSVDFEASDANGRGVSLFDRDRLRGLMLRLPEAARQSFADMLEAEVMPGLAKRTREIRDALQQQADSEDCVRGLIAFAREEVPA